MLGAPDLPKFQLKRLTADGAVSATPIIVYAILVDGNHADWKVELTNDADGSGTNVVQVGSEAEGGQTFFDFTNLGGVLFNSKCYADITVTAGIVHIWYEGHNANQLASR